MDGSTQQVDVAWCQGAQNIGLANHKLKSAVNSPHGHNAHRFQTDGWTDERTL